jgi:hypothetical protein
VSRPVALVMTYAYPEEENRLKTQLAELLRIGFEVHTLGFGAKRIDGVTKHFEIPKRQNLIGLARVALIHLIFPTKSRFHPLRSPRPISKKLQNRSYDLVIAHDLELLPLLLDRDIRPSSFETSVKQVDLHELHEFRPTMNGIANIVWKFLGFRIKPYHEWLMSLLRSPELDLATVVNKSIGDWYVANNYLQTFTEVMNAAPYRNVTFENRQTDALDFIYHGRYARHRGLEKLVAASLAIRSGDRFHFMLTGRKRDLQNFKSYALAKNPSIVFHESVPMEQVGREISKFDAEIIYFEPVSKNLHFTLPNKFFEAIQGRLAVVSGPSPEILRFTSSFRCGVATCGWEVGQLSMLLAGLDRAKIEVMREASHELSSQLNSDTESEKLRLAWKKLLPSLGSHSHS